MWNIYIIITAYNPVIVQLNIYNGFSHNRSYSPIQSPVIQSQICNWATASFQVCACGHPTASPHQRDEHQVVLHKWSWLVGYAFFFNVTWRLCNYKLTSESFENHPFWETTDNLMFPTGLSKFICKSETFAAVNALYFVQLRKKIKINWRFAGIYHSVWQNITKATAFAFLWKRSHQSFPDVNTLYGKVLAASS